jgi:isomerase DpgB
VNALDAELSVTELPDGLGLAVDIDGTRTMETLTSALQMLCDLVQESRETVVAVLRLDGTLTDPQPWPGDVQIQAVNRWERAVRRLERLSVATIAVAQGPCGGPALDLWLAADFRLASIDTQLVLPVNDGRCWPGMVLFRLVQNIGLVRARQLALWGTSLSATAAAELGLVDEISSDVEMAVHAAAVRLGPVSDRDLTIRRKLLFEAATTDYDEALGSHLAACDRELRRLRGTTIEPEVTEPAGRVA